MPSNIHTTRRVKPRPGGPRPGATVDGVDAGCGGVRGLSRVIGEVRRLFVRRTARGEGLGRLLLSGLEWLARELGLEELRLDTVGDPAAVALFRSAGWEPIADYNGNPRARYWFGKSCAALSRTEDLPLVT